MTDNRLHTRRTLMATGGLSLALLAAGRAGVAMAWDDATPVDAEMADMTDMDAAKAAIRERMGEFTSIWRATSPATHSGDTYTLTITNTSATVQSAYVLAMIMDHHAHANTPVLTEEIDLAAGASRTLTATNAYGTANHFQTTILADTDAPRDVQLVILVKDATGVETARFTQGAFWIESIAELRASANDAAKSDKDRRRKRRQERRNRRGAADATPTAETTPTT